MSKKLEIAISAFGSFQELGKTFRRVQREAKAIEMEFHGTDLLVYATGNPCGIFLSKNLGR